MNKFYLPVANIVASVQLNFVVILFRACDIVSYDGKYRSDVVWKINHINENVIDTKTKLWPVQTKNGKNEIHTMRKNTKRMRGIIVSTLIQTLNFGRRNQPSIYISPKLKSDKNLKSWIFRECYQRRYSIIIARIIHNEYNYCIRIISMSREERI